jgi:type I restriction enzyme M protein
VIGLPANVFYGTSIPTCILVFKKCRETPDDILFIDASRDFEKVKNQNALREADIQKITSAYAERSETEKYSRCVPLTEIAENDYNLNIPRYIDTFEEEEEIDLDSVAAKIRQLDEEISETDKELAAFCRELGIATPF